MENKSGCDSGLLQLPKAREDQSFRVGFWQWVALLAAGDYAAAVEALSWGDQERFKPEELEKRIATFFNDSDVLVPIVPNERLVALIDDKMEIEWEEEDGWATALIPVTNDPRMAKDDEVPLMGVAVSFFIVAQGDHQNLEFEAMHV